MDVNVSGEVYGSHTEEAVLQLKAFKVLGVSREKLVEMFGHSGLSRYEGMLAELEARNASRETKLIEHEAKEIKSVRRNEHGMISMMMAATRIDGQWTDAGAGADVREGCGLPTVSGASMDLTESADWGGLARASRLLMQCSCG